MADGPIRLPGSDEIKTTSTGEGLSVEGLEHHLRCAHEAARAGRHDVARHHLATAERAPGAGEIDCAIAAVYLMVGDASDAERMLNRARSRGPLSSLGLGVQSTLECTAGQHEASRRTAAQWLARANTDGVTAEDLLTEDHSGFRLPAAHSRFWEPAQRLLANGQLRQALSAMNGAGNRSPHFRIGSALLRTRGGTLPRWDGERTGHLTLLCPDGHGDAFFAWRYVQHLLARVDRLTVVTTAASAFMLSDLIPSVEVLPLAESAVALRTSTRYIDWWRLPGLLDTFAPEPYIPLPEPMPLDEVDGLSVGLVYGGNHANRDNGLRSVPVADLGPLLAVPGIAWHSLMVDPEYAANLPAGVIDLAPRLQSFRDTAAAIAALDLIITVDSAVANLAAAMGRPTWVLVERDGDFRWFGPDGRSRWFTAAQVFRQANAGEWGPVVAHAAACLQDVRTRAKPSVAATAATYGSGSTRPREGPGV